MSKAEEFTKLNITTQSFMVYTNCLFDIEKIKENLVVIPCKSYKTQEGKTHGEFYHVTPKKYKKPFRNQVSVRVFVINKIVTVKILKTGKFQMTGCKTNEHAYHAAISILNKIHNYGALIRETDPENIKIIFEPVMINVGFNLTFAVDQKALDILVQKTCEDNFYTDYEATTNTSVNLKMVYDEPTVKSFYQIELPKNHDFNISTDVSKKFKTSLVTECLKSKKQEKRNHTFLVFASSKNNKSSKVILSGKYYGSEMQKAYHKFLDFVTKNQGKIEMKSKNEKFDISELKGVF